MVRAPMVRRSPRPRGRASGFALVDVIVGAVILGSALAMIVGLAGQAVTAQLKGQDLATASALADEQLQLVLGRGPDDYDRRFGSNGRCEEPFEDYWYALKVSGSGQAEPYEVAVTVSWERAWGKQSLTIRTLAATRIAGEEFESDPERRPETPIQRIIE
jgi:type II secretory pathway pseudopilin PulG